ERGPEFPVHDFHAPEFLIDLAELAHQLGARRAVALGVIPREATGLAGAPEDPHHGSQVPAAQGLLPGEFDAVSEFGEEKVEHDGEGRREEEADEKELL